MTLSLLPFWALAIAAAWSSARVVWDRRPFALLLSGLLLLELARFALLRAHAPLALGRAFYVGEYGALCGYLVHRTSFVRSPPLLLVWTIAAALAAFWPVQPWGVYWASRILVIAVPVTCRQIARRHHSVPIDCGILWGWWGVSDLVTGIQADSIPTQYVALSALTLLEVYRAWSAYRGTPSPG